MDIRDQFDGLIDGLAKLGKGALLRDKVYELTTEINTFTCGDCSYWMTSSCPLEKNVNGYNRGPSMNDPICDIFCEKVWCKNLRKERKRELEDVILELKNL